MQKPASLVAIFVLPAVDIGFAAMERQYEALIRDEALSIHNTASQLQMTEGPPPHAASCAESAVVFYRKGRPRRSTLIVTTAGYLWADAAEASYLSAA
jgi:hypothetical protein